MASIEELIQYRNCLRQCLKIHQWRILMNILGIPQVSYYIILPTTAIVAFHLLIILDTYQIYWNGSSIRQDKNLFNLKIL